MAKESDAVAPYKPPRLPQMKHPADGTYGTNPKLLNDQRCKHFGHVSTRVDRELFEAVALRAEARNIATTEMLRQVIIKGLKHIPVLPDDYFDISEEELAAQVTAAKRRQRRNAQKAESKQRAKGKVAHGD